MVVFVGIIGGLLIAVVIYDLLQRKHAILRNFPIVGHFRYLLEAVGPELRQYIVTDNNSERPFSRDQRRWVYASSKAENNTFGFGTDNDIERTPGYVIFKPVVFPIGAPPPGHNSSAPKFALPGAKVLGGARGRRHKFRPPSGVNISSMSFGSLSSVAVEAMNLGAAIADCLHGTGEGGISPHHLHGGDLVWQLGTGYFGCRDNAGNFDRNRFLEAVASNPIRAVEIKLSQGAKAGLGGLLPAAKVTKSIAELRGIERGRDCISPASHSAFGDADSLLDFVEDLAEATGLPVGIKSAVGDLGFWRDLASLMEGGERGVDFITIDGGEGGTGAGPLVFADHVALPFRAGFPRVYREFAMREVHDDVVFIGSGKLGLPDTALVAFAMGCDQVNVGREVMLSVGCIQAQRCHSGRCPTGVTTNSPWRMHGLDPQLKSVRVANYLIALRKELLQLSRACGFAHPALMSTDQIELLDGVNATLLRESTRYEPGWGKPSPKDQAALLEIMGSTQ